MWTKAIFAKHEQETNLANLKNAQTEQQGNSRNLVNVAEQEIYGEEDTNEDGR